MQIAQYVTYSSIYGEEATVDDVQQTLSQVDSRLILIYCCTVGIVLRLWARQGTDLKVYSPLIQKFFEPSLASAILQKYPAWQVFSRRQLLAVERFAIENYHETSLLSENDSAQAFGHLCIMANDQLHFGLAGIETDKEKIMRNLFVEMIPIGEDAGSNIYARTTRTATLMHEVAESMKSDPDYIDFSAEFHLATGVQLSEFHACCFGMLTKWVNYDANQPHRADDVFLAPHWFSSSALDKSIFEKIFSALSANADAYKKAFLGKKNEDFTPFRERPMLQIGPGYLPTDLTNLADAFESFPFWTLNAVVSPDRLRRFWGKVFEQYVNRITLAIADSKLNQCVPAPRFDGNGEEICDLAIRCGPNLVLIESKGVMFTRQAKYSGEPLACFKEIHQKLVKNEKGKNKGVSQLSAAIRRVFLNKEVSSSLDINGVRRVFPLLVSSDSLGENPLFSNVLNLYFDSASLSKDTGVAVELLLGIGIETYEHMTGLLSDTALSTILADWLEHPASPAWLGSFAMIDTPLTHTVDTRRNPYVEERFRALTESMARLLFPEEPPIKTESLGN